MACKFPLCCWTRPLVCSENYAPERSEDARERLIRSLDSITAHKPDALLDNFERVVDAAPRCRSAVAAPGLKVQSAPIAIPSHRRVPVRRAAAGGAPQVPFR